MPITRHHSGRWLYQFDRVVEGQRVRANKLLPEGTSRKEAVEFDQRETKRLWRLATGADKPEPLIDDAVLLYLEHHAPRLKNHAGIVGNLAILQPHFTGRPLSALPDVAREYGKQKGLSPATIRNRLAYLRAACKWAWKHHGMGEHDPTERMVLPKVSNARHVYLTRADMLRVARAMGLSWSRDAVRVAFYTGWRISEVLGSQAVETPEGWVLAIADSKNGLPRIVPVHPKITHLVSGAWPPQVTGWTVSKEAKKAFRAVGLGHARLHDLRHSAASEMINAGIDLFTIGGVLGHKSQQSTARYAHLAHGRLKQAVGSIGARKSQPAVLPKAA